MAKTNFVSGDFLTPTFMEKIFGTTAATGHKHNGLDQDGSVPKVNLSSGSEVQGTLPKNMCKDVEGAHSWLETVVTNGSGTVNYSNTSTLYEAIVNIIQSESPEPDLTPYIKKDGSVDYTGTQTFLDIETTSTGGGEQRKTDFSTWSGGVSSRLSNIQATVIEHQGGYGNMWLVSGRARCGELGVALSDMMWPVNGYLVHDVYFVSQVGSGDTSSLRRFNYSFLAGDGVMRYITDYIGEAQFTHNGTNTAFFTEGDADSQYLQWYGTILQFENKVPNPITGWE